VKYWALTFGNCEEAQKNKGMSVSMTDIIVDVANRYVKRIEFVIAGGNGYSCFVTAQDDWDECASECCFILQDYILLK